MAILAGRSRVIRHLSFFLAAAILATAALAGSNVSAGEIRNFILGTDPAAIVDGHHYAVLAVDLSDAARFRVSLRSTEVDSFLTLVSPDQALHDDDQSGGDSDALIEIAAPAPGRWLIVATTVNEGETGRVELALDPGTVDDSAVVTLPEPLAAIVIAERDDRAEQDDWAERDKRDETRLRAGPVALQEADIDQLALWLGEAAHRDGVLAIISRKFAKLEAERERLRADLAIAEAGLAEAALPDDAEPGDAATGEATPEDTGGEIALLRDALAEIDTLLLGLDDASDALSQIAALASVAAGGDGVQQVIRALVAETKAKRDGFASSEAMTMAHRETLARRLVVSDIVVIETMGPVASDAGPAPSNPMIDRGLYREDAAQQP